MPAGPSFSQEDGLPGSSPAMTLKRISSIGNRFSLCATCKRKGEKVKGPSFIGLALFVAVAFAPAAVRADDIRVLSTGNMQSILGALAGDFDDATGNKLIFEYGSTPKMKARIEAGDPADLTINERYVLDDLLKSGHVEAGTLIDIARSPLGVGVKAGAPKPTIATEDAFKNALLAAETIAVPDPSGGAQDGVYFFGLIARMGIADMLKPKIKLTQGGDAAAQAVASGAAQIGIAQKRNFNALPGIEFLMVAGVVKGTHEHDAALAFARFLASPAAAPTIVAKGMEPYAIVK